MGQGLTVFVAAAGALIVSSSASSTQGLDKRCRVIFPDGTIVHAEVADTEAARQRGLMFRETLARASGMLFVFDRPGSYAFWMKNTLIPLDLVWLDGTGRVVSLAVDVPPCKADPCPSYPPGAEARYVLEVASGFTTNRHLQIGDRLMLEGLPEK